MKIAIFNNSKYTKWYLNIINIAKIQNRKYDSNFHEKHHIIPKSLGGNNKKENIAILTFKEHYICHILLTKMCEGRSVVKMNWALHRLSNSKKHNSLNYSLSRKLHISFLKNNHHSRRIEGWNDKMKAIVLDSWKDNDIRRKQQSDRMKHRYVSNTQAYFVAINNLPKDTKGINNGNVLSIEYKGKIYYGWRELKEATRVTKELYKKYYINGIDPEFRIGANGPVSRKKENQHVQNSHSG